MDRTEFKATLTAEEQEAMDHLLTFMSIVNDWGPNCNGDELARGVHQLQLFVIMHMLARISPGDWSEWYDR